MKLWFLGLLVIILSVCGQAQNNELADTSWLLQSYGPAKAQQNVLPNKAISLEIGETNVGGSGGCNGYGGIVIVHGNTFRLKEIESTTVGCIDSNIMQQEERYFDILLRVTTFENTDTTLTLSAGEDRLEFISNSLE